MLIKGLLESAEEQLLQLRGVQRGSSAEAAERLLRGLRYTVGQLQEAAREVALGAVAAGVRPEDVAAWAGRFPAALTGPAEGSDGAAR
ncbi:hypothetical protein [Kitasatospora paracochleata]|uniref:hypothetical protein n=1 Tax=Kitasatospora paracochleata TaxID=58354 RepID=UPI0031D65EA8